MLAFADEFHHLKNDFFHTEMNKDLMEKLVKLNVELENLKEHLYKKY